MMIDLQWITPDVLALIFGGLIAFAMLVYALLDGYDLGVGMLSRYATPAERDVMIGAIGPFWDANETWLVLGVGLLLVAFPEAHGIVLTNLYVPATIMLIGLIFRGIAFECRVKMPPKSARRWDDRFFWGSFVTTFAQGVMLGDYILGFPESGYAHLFSLLIGFSVVAGYSLIGACWLIYKTDGILQRKAVEWAQIALYATVVGIFLVSGTTPLMSERIFERWFSFPNMLLLAPVPLLTAAAVFGVHAMLGVLRKRPKQYTLVPYLLTSLVFVLCFAGLAFSYYPYIVPEQMTIYEATSAPESLRVILIGAVIVVPVLLLYTAYVYWVFRGKASSLSYE